MSSARGPTGGGAIRDAAMRDFASAVDDHARESGKTITVVFNNDPGPLTETSHINIVVARSRGPNAADYEIERLVKDAKDPKRQRVVTSDRALSDKITAAGATVI